MIRKNPNGDRPKIHRSAYIDPAAIIIGAVTIGRQVFVGPGAVLRADEPGSAIVIGNCCNIQDRVVVHALSGTKVVIHTHTSLSHGCIVHGPCRIGARCFIGFGSVVFGSTVGDNVFVKHLAVIEDARVPKSAVIPSKAVIGDGKASKQPTKPAAFARKVVAMNLTLLKGYTSHPEAADHSV